MEGRMKEGKKHQELPYKAGSKKMKTPPRMEKEKGVKIYSISLRRGNLEKGLAQAGADSSGGPRGSFIVLSSTVSIVY